MYVIHLATTYDVVIGMPWFHYYDPVIGWRKGTIQLSTKDGFAVLRSDKFHARAPEFLLSAQAFTRAAKKAAIERTWLCILRSPDKPPAGYATPASIAAQWAAQIQKEFEDVLREELEPGLPGLGDIIHHIPTEPGAVPPCRPPYRLSPDENRELQRQLAKLLELGYIRPSNSPYCAPVLFTKKKTGGLRMVIDYRGLNKITQKSGSPLPTIPELLDRLQGAKWFTGCDLNQAFHQVRIADEDVHKTAFRTRFGQYEYLVMPFGLTGAPSTFQRLISSKLQHLMYPSDPNKKGFVIVYLDDVLIYSETLEEHVRHVREVFQVLREANLTARPSKCQFCVQRIPFLGHIVSDQGLEVDGKKNPGLAPSYFHQGSSILPWAG